MQFILPREDGESVIQAEDCLRSATTIRMKYISVRGDICNSSALERRRRRPAARMSPERPSGSEARHERLQYPNDIVLFILPSLKYSHSSPILLAYAQIGTKHLERSRRMGNAGTTARLWRSGSAGGVCEKRLFRKRFRGDASVEEIGMVVNWGDNLGRDNKKGEKKLYMTGSFPIQRKTTTTKALVWRKE